MAVLIWLPAILAGVVLLLFALALLIPRLARGLERARTRVPLDVVVQRLEPMLRRMQPGAHLAAIAHGGDAFLQLALTARYAEWREVEFGLPEAGWARPYFNEAIVALGKLGSEWRVEHNPGNTRVPRFLRVWIEGPQDEVRERAGALLRAGARVLGFPPDQRWNVEFHGHEHPEYLRSLADQLERKVGDSRLHRRWIAALRRQADRAERATDTAR